MVVRFTLKARATSVFDVPEDIVATTADLCSLDNSSFWPLFPEITVPKARNIVNVEQLEMCCLFPQIARDAKCCQTYGLALYIHSYEQSHFHIYLHNTTVYHHFKHSEAIRRTGKH